MSTDESSLLKRETILPSSDRGRLAAIIATCSMAGLAGGMALSMLAESQRVADELRRQELKAELRMAEDADHAPHAWLGINIATVPGDCAGAKVVKVVPRSPAARAGFQVGDVVETFGGDAVCDDDHLIAVVRGSSIYATPPVGVRRGAEHLVLQPRLGILPRRH